VAYRRTEQWKYRPGQLAPGSISKWGGIWANEKNEKKKTEKEDEEREK